MKNDWITFPRETVTHYHGIQCTARNVFVFQVEICPHHARLQLSEQQGSQFPKLNQPQMCKRKFFLKEGIYKKCLKLLCKQCSTCLYCRRVEENVQNEETETYNCADSAESTEIVYNQARPLPKGPTFNSARSKLLHANWMSNTPRRKKSKYLQIIMHNAEKGEKQQPK